MAGNRIDPRRHDGNTSMATQGNGEDRVELMLSHW
jgi:hypothetical protein